MKLSMLSVGPSWEMGLPSALEGALRVVSAVDVIAKHPPNEFIPVPRAVSPVFVRTEILGQGRGSVLNESLWSSPHAFPFSLCGGPSFGLVVTH